MEDHVFDPAVLGLGAPVCAVNLDDASATVALGAALARAASPGDVVGLIGTLGAGKTTFTQGFCDELEVGEATSPTYTLLNVYRGDPSVFHFDLYRLEHLDDLEGIGYWDYVESGEGVSIVEWLDKIPDAWTSHGLVVHLTYSGDARHARVWATDESVAARVRSEMAE